MWYWWLFNILIVLWFKRFFSLSVTALMHLYWPRPLDDSGVNRQWLGWLLSLMILFAFLWHRVLLVSWRAGSLLPVIRWQTATPSGELCGCGRCSCHTRRDTAGQNAINYASVKVYEGLRCQTKFSSRGWRGALTPSSPHWLCGWAISVCQWCVCRETWIFPPSPLRFSQCG